MQKEETLTPRQIEFLRYFLDPKSESFSNIKASAIKAGYSDEYATVLGARDLDWLSDNVNKKRKLIDKAEKNLEELLDKGEEKTKADLTKFTLSRLNKKEYSERQEITGKEGEKLIPIYNGQSFQGHDSDEKNLQPEEKD